jgi:hypothetical protein
MYALLAGRPPFRAKTMPEMLQMQRFAEPEPVRRYAPDTPEQLERLIQQLLAKEPDNRFPNVLVLGRHMEAMEKALSRPAASTDSEELDLEWPTEPAPPNVTVQGGRDATNAGQVRLTPKRTGPQEPNLYEAATIAQPEAPAVSPVAPTLAPPTPAPAPPKGTRFTTVDEDARRRQRQEEEESHVAFIARWVALLVLIGGMSWGAWKLFRPASADELYAQITSAIEREGDEDLRLVETELTEFMKRFPDDPRKDELATYVSQLEFQRLQRKARTRSRIAGAKSLGPIEQLYLSALGMVETDPVKAATMLSSLIDLYDPLGVTAGGQVATGNDRSALTEDDRRWLVLARKELKKLDDQATADAKHELPAVEERLAAAEVVARVRPEQAKKMYQAIVSLYRDAPWAAAAVKKAQVALDAMEETETE